MPYIESGTKLILKPLPCDASESGIELVSHFKSKTPDKHIIFEAPVHDGVLYPVSSKEPLHVSFLYKDGICRFKCVAVEQFNEEGLNYINARIITGISHTQRRRHFRVKEAIPGEITIWTRNNAKTNEACLECISCNISCGGIALYTKEACEVGKNIIVSILLWPEHKAIRLYSKVKWRKNAVFGTYSFLIGVQFYYSCNSEKEAVRNYVHQLQLKMIPKMHNKK